MWPQIRGVAVRPVQEHRDLDPVFLRCPLHQPLRQPLSPADDEHKLLLAFTLLRYVRDRERVGLEGHVRDGREREEDVLARHPPEGDPPGER